MNEPRGGRSTRQANSAKLSTWSQESTSAGGRLPVPVAVAHAEKDQFLRRALDEYCRLQDQGSPIPASQFCDRYPSYRHSLRRLIDVQDVFGGIDIDEFHWPAVGTEFLGFQILGELGVGAIARVYLAIQPELGGRLVAIKVAHGRGDEAATLGKLTHPNVVPVYSVDYDPDSELSVVCMPYQGSATLADLLDMAFESQGPPKDATVILKAGSCRERLAELVTGSGQPDAAHSTLKGGTYVEGVALLGRQIAEALAYTHERKILHRDLKPSNVLLTPSGVPKLLDFNLSVDLEIKQPRVGGTLPYMPPEQIRDVHLFPFAKSASDDPRSDLFSLGVILYELLTGRLPFGDPPDCVSPRAAAEIYLESQQRQPTPIRTLNPAVDRHLATVVQQCLELDLQLRPASAQELVDQFRRHFSTLRRATRWSRRHFLLSGAAALSVLVPAGWGAVYLATRPPYPERLYQAGVEDYLAGRSRSAAQRFTNLIDLTGESKELLFARGAAWMQGGDYDWAAKDFSKIYFDPLDALAGECFAYASAKDSNYDVASAVYVVVLQESRTNDVQDRLNIAHCHIYNKRYVESEHWAIEALKLEPDNQLAYCLLAESRLRITYDLKSELREVYKPLAVADFDRAIELGPDDPALLCRAAQAYSRLDSFDVGHLASLLERAIVAGAVRSQLENVENIPVVQTWKDAAWYQDLLRRCVNTEYKGVSPWPQALVPPDQGQIQARLTGQLGKTLPMRKASSSQL